jgi:magnesium-protoporphyrin O-methyltransferase
MDRCGCDDYASPIDADIARKDRESYHSDGPDNTTRILLNMIEAETAEGVTLLDVGGGIGVIDHELLRTRASSAVLVEASPAYLDAARAEAQEAGLLDRLDIVAGDIVQRPDEVGPADVVTLDRVICCYPDADKLVSASASRARKWYGMVLPRDRWYVRWFTGLENVWMRLKRDPYRAHAHSNVAIDAQLQDMGLMQRSETFTAWWRVVLFTREEASGLPPPAISTRRRPAC